MLVDSENSSFELKIFKKFLGVVLICLLSFFLKNKNKTKKPQSSFEGIINKE